MRIGSFDTEKRVLLIAEIGNNHEGDVSVARELVEEAARCGADAVKFQTFRTEHYVRAADAERFERLKRFELPQEDVTGLAELARSRGLLFLSTPFDLGSVDLLADLVDAFKVASGDLTFVPLLRRIASTGKPVLLSTGMGELDEIRESVRVVRDAWGSDGELAVLHCVSSYPVPPEEASLRAIVTLQAELDCTIGYSDHTVGLDAAPLAVALGAQIVEKHFTLDKNYSEFRDHALSADPAELRELVARVRVASELLGGAGKTLQPSERGSVSALRRSIVAAADLPAGHVLAEADLTWTRPADGLPPGSEDLLLGRSLIRAVHFGEPLREADVT
jgi:N,N'-diacetyllegionaminate synthase